MSKYKIDFDSEEVDIAGRWHGGQSSMLYAIASTGSLGFGSHRPRMSGDLLTDDEWFYDLASRLEQEALSDAEDAEEQAGEAKSDKEEEELFHEADVLRSIAAKATKAMKRVG